MRRHNQILALVLVVQIALSVVVFWPRSAATSEGEPLFPDLESDAIAALTITDDQGSSIRLRKSSGEWTAPDADDYPAQGSKIEPVLEEIIGLDTGRLVTRTDSSHKRLQVAEEDFVRRVVLETKDGTRHTLYLGSSPSYGATHFRLEGQSEVYLTDDLTAAKVGANAAAWIDTAYFSIEQEKLTQVTLENENGAFVFTKSADNGWTMDGLEEGEEVNSNKISTVINKVSSIAMIRPLGAEEKESYGTDVPTATVTLEAGDQTVTLRVGSQDPDDNSYVIKTSESPYYVRVSKYVVQELVESGREDFIQPPPTPTPEGESDTD